MNLTKYPSKKEQKQLVKRPLLSQKKLSKSVKKILSTVRSKGDLALYSYAEIFDKVKLESIKVSKKEIKEGQKKVSEDLQNAIKQAKANIQKFHAAQQLKSKKVETTKGVVCWQKSVGIEKVGLYIPGGSAPLFSTILMLGIPAQIAGCKEIILCTPPNTQGKINPAILYTAALIGIKKIYKIGGAQAIAAMAYGTETVPSVYKIFGPGNQYVTKAKELVQQDRIAIDMPAGPSEVLVVADKTSNPAFVAADLLSQAEHGADSQVILVSDNQPIIKSILAETDNQIKKLPRKNIAKKALENSHAILLKSINECIEFSNNYAPEHLILASKSAEKHLDKITNAGSVFIGNYSCESAGDYASGTNHTLPTNGFAKNYSGVSLDSFVKKITFQKLSKKGIKRLGPAIEIMAAAEGLDAHKNAVTLRLEKLKKYVL